VIAAIQGVAFAAASSSRSAPTCDSCPDAKMSIMEIKWGLVPDMGGVERRMPWPAWCAMTPARVDLYGADLSPRKR